MANNLPPEGAEFNLVIAAKKTGYCEQHLRRKCKNGEVPCVQRGHNYFFTAEDIAQIIPRRGPGSAQPKPRPIAGGVRRGSDAAVDLGGAAPEAPAAATIDPLTPPADMVDPLTGK